MSRESLAPSTSSGRTGLNPFVLSSPTKYGRVEAYFSNKFIQTQLIVGTKKALIFLIDNLWPIFRMFGYCRYTISCSQYARIMLEQEPLSRALVLIIKRILSCNPLTQILRQFKIRSC